jgi:hypothetical protein
MVVLSPPANTGAVNKDGVVLLAFRTEAQLLLLYMPLLHKQFQRHLPGMIRPDTRQLLLGAHLCHPRVTQWASTPAQH